MVENLYLYHDMNKLQDITAIAITGIEYIFIGAKPLKTRTYYVAKKKKILAICNIFQYATSSQQTFIVSGLPSLIPLFYYSDVAYHNFERNLIRLAHVLLPRLMVSMLSKS